MLEQQGFGAQLAPTRNRPPKLSAKAKVQLLVWQLNYREWDAHRTTDEETREYHSPSIAHGLLLQWGEYEAAAVFTSGATPRTAWRMIQEAHSAVYDKLLGAFHRAVDDRSVVLIGNERFVLGEAKHLRERFQRLQKELGSAVTRASDEPGSPFVATPTAEASVRKWIQLRRRQARPTLSPQGSDTTAEGAGARPLAR